MGEIHELFVLALFLVWFAGATPDFGVPFSKGCSFPLFHSAASERHGAHAGLAPILKSAGKVPSSAHRRKVVVKRETVGMTYMGWRYM